MRHKVLWITFWMTMVYWLAGAWGCATEPARDHRTARLVPLAHVDNEPTTAPAPALRSETQPSLQGLDRSRWPKVVIAIGDGRVTHFPIYFADWQISGGQIVAGAKRTAGPEAGAEQADVPEQIAQALTPTRAGNWSDLNNTIDAALGPVKFPFDLVMLPVNMFRQAPWKTTTTP